MLCLILCTCTTQCYGIEICVFIAKSILGDYSVTYDSADRLNYCVLQLDIFLFAYRLLCKICF